MSKENPIFFVSYAHADNKKQIVEHFLSILKAQKYPNWTIWTDEAIPIGNDWSNEISTALKSCDFGILLVSAEFATSKYIQEIELPELLSNKKVIPVLLSPYNLAINPVLSKKQFFQYELGSLISFLELLDTYTDRTGWISNNGKDILYIEKLVRKINDLVFKEQNTFSNDKQTISANTGKIVHNISSKSDDVIESSHNSFNDNFNNLYPVVENVLSRSFSTFKELIAQNKLAEALDFGITNVKDESLRNTLILLNGRYTNIQNNNRISVPKSKDYVIEVNQIANALIDLADKLIEQEVTEEKTENASVVSILFIGAGPEDQDNLKLRTEVRKIKEELERGYDHSRKRVFKFESELAASVKDLTRYILRLKPAILHFSGHGSGQDGLVFENEQGQSEILPNKAINLLFKSKKYIQCVVLNSCYSSVQAEAISAHGITVIGMNQAIEDQVAIDFSIGFYQALSAGEQFKEAYENGLVNAAISGEEDMGIPEFWSKGVKG